MNAFLEHHQQAIRFAYSGFDRILLNAIIQVLQNPAAVAGFLKEKRLASQLTPAYFRVISTDYHHFVQALAEQRQVEIVVPPKDGRREEWVEPFYQRLPGQDGIAVILKSRENARVAVSYPRCGNHIELANRFVWQYYFGSCNQFGGSRASEQYPQELVGDRLEVVGPLENDDVLF
jgi:hypothetical protein